MADIPWNRPINFASALLLHSCVTILLKETLNLVVISKRLSLRYWYARKGQAHKDSHDRIATSVVLDAYTSLFSHDHDGELAELYFTNTGFLLLAVSLASSVAMNLLLPSLLPNMFIAGVFGLAFLASFVTNKLCIVLPILALRRAGRFIWSDTPFVNFFSLIYIATALHGQATLRLRDYITFRAIAVLELMFMKGRLAACSPRTQIKLMRQLIDSEWVVISANLDRQYLDKPFPAAQYSNMVAFTTLQRLSVMLCKTRVGFELGSLQGPSGPATCPLPEVKHHSGNVDNGWEVYRYSEDVMLLVDRFAGSEPKGNSKMDRLLASAHGVLLRRMGKVRVIYLIRARPTGDDLSGPSTTWHSNVNLVTGVTGSWLAEFHTAEALETCIIC
ncbi:hypothetical protein LTR17_026063 [Elasticomyces elasticus]|nr:hypothetical protein LTR17_026063 [Elasticomyces elasticus]